MTDIEKVARAMAEQDNDYDADVLQWECWLDSAKAAIAAMQPAPQEPVGSAAEITSLNEAVRARVDAAYSALRVAAAHVDALAERIRDTAPWYIRRAVESEAKTLEGAAVMIRALDPAKIVDIA